MKGRLATLLLVGAFALASAPAARAQAPATRILREIGFDQRLGETVPLDLAFRDEAGRTVRLGDYFDKKPVVLSLVYYDCPMLCTLTLNGLTAALGRLPFDVGKEFQVITVSFDPRETPSLAAAKKKAYLHRYARPTAAEGWHFLTGEPAAIDQLTKAVGFRYVWDADTRQFAHAAGILVLTPEGRIARYLYGIEYAPKDLRLALVETSAGRVGSPVDQLLLYCYHYDPATGRYGPAVMSLLRAASGATVLVLAAAISLMWRRERKGQSA
jgi:protein SCO1/2